MRVDAARKKIEDGVVIVEAKGEGETRSIREGAVFGGEGVPRCVRVDDLVLFEYFRVSTKALDNCDVVA